MSRIEDSVGQGGGNREADVLLVQQLLNRHDLAPLEEVAEDGRASPLTITAIRHFQARHVGMASPDGRVEPFGRTFRVLAGGTTRRGKGASPETRRADRELRARLVDPRVQETEVTKRIIDRLLPHLAQIRARVIAGYLSDTDQFWKVNYHWEYLLQAVEYARTLDLEPAVTDALDVLRSNLRSCPPDPDRGYTSGAVGKPQDRSSADQTISRHAVLTQAKREFRRLVDRHHLKEKSRRSPKIFDLAAAPVAKPGTSKHGTGHALDIEGDNAAIKDTCRAQGATYVLDEQSHVHAEFAHG